MGILRRTWGLLFLALVVMLAEPPLLFAITLEEAHRAASKNMERIAQSEQAVLEAQAEVRRRWSAVSPNLSLKVSELIQDKPDTAAAGSSGSAIESTFFRRSKPEVALNLQYVFFSGLREFAALSASKADERSRRAVKERTLQLLYGDVARAYFGIIERKHALDILSARRKVLEDRRRELLRFEKLGRSRPSERVTVEADIKALEADIEAVKGEFQSTGDLFSFLTGLKPVPPLTDEETSPTAPLPSLDECLANLSGRPDVRAQREQVQVAQKTVTFEKGSYWPTAEVNANYYPYRVGYLENIQWDVNLLFDWPFFQGGRTRAEVQKAKAGLRSAELVLAEAEKLAKLDAQNKHTVLTAETARLKSLLEALALREENYGLQAKEYRLGLVNNLEVLSSLSDLYRTKLDVEVTQSLATIHRVEFAVACGMIRGIRE